MNFQRDCIKLTRSAAFINELGAFLLIFWPIINFQEDGVRAMAFRERYFFLHGCSGWRNMQWQKSRPPLCRVNAFPLSRNRVSARKDSQLIELDTNTL